MNLYAANHDLQQLLDEIKTIDLYIQRMHNISKCGIIDLGEAVILAQMTAYKKERIKAAVRLVHITKDGRLRSFNYSEKKKMFYSRMADGSKVWGRDEDALYQNLFKRYGLTVYSTDIKTIYEQARDKKIQENNISEESVKRYNADYNRFISSEFGKRDIRNITLDDLKAYTLQMVNEIHPKIPAFKAYKGILNLIFRYALDTDIILRNPVSGLENRVYYKSCDTVKPQPVDKIFSPHEIELIKEKVIEWMYSSHHKNHYFINGRAILFSIETGVRVGEIPSIKWSDINFERGYIWIHTQQLTHKHKGQPTIYELVFYTKNEKGVSNGGRYFPITSEIKKILLDIQDIQKKLGINSEYVFCNEDGDWIKAEAYEGCLRRLCRSLGLNLTNNHAFRMSLNSNVLIPKGFTVTERAVLLGHSVETNLKHYSHAEIDNLAVMHDKFR